MNDITSYSGLNPANLDRSDYMNTLAAEALRAGLINESDIDRIRSDLMTALAEVIGYYTKNESSSVMADTANELSESMVYNIDTYLLSLTTNAHLTHCLTEECPNCTAKDTP